MHLLVLPLQVFLVSYMLQINVVSYDWIFLKKLQKLSAG